MSEVKLIEVLLGRIVIHERSDRQFIFLVEKGGQRQFPIVIGIHEAAEIHRVISEDQPERPLTHQLAFDMVGSLGAAIVRAEIVDLRKNTFYASVVLRSASGEELRVDARPSDAIALALRARASIFVAESVIDEVRTDEGGPDPLPPSAPEA